jgi:hypothetical protein
MLVEQTVNSNLNNGELMTVDTSAHTSVSIPKKDFSSPNLDELLAIVTFFYTLSWAGRRWRVLHPQSV